MKKFAFSLLLLISLISCTIEKRLHRPGWHIESIGSHRGSKIHSSSEKENNTAQTPTETIQPEVIRPTASEPIQVLAVTDSLIVPELHERETNPAATTITEEPDAPAATSFIPRQLKRIINKPFRQKTDGIDDPKPKQVSPLIIAMWVLNIILTAAFIILAIALLLGTGAYPLITAGLVFLFVTPIFLLGNIILGALAFKQRQKYPDKYRHASIGLAMFGGLMLVIGGVLFVLVVSLLALILDYRF